MVKLDMKTPDELAQWLPEMWEHYVSERIKAGEDPKPLVRVRRLSNSNCSPMAAR